MKETVRVIKHFSLGLFKNVPGLIYALYLYAVYGSLLDVNFY